MYKKFRMQKCESVMCKVQNINMEVNIGIKTMGRVKLSAATPETVTELLTVLLRKTELYQVLHIIYAEFFGPRRVPKCYDGCSCSCCYSFSKNA